MISKSDSNFYRRELAIIDGAKLNVLVNELILKHYNHIKLLYYIDNSIFIDTYLLLTYSFKKGDFINEFKRIFFNSLKEKLFCEIQYNKMHKSLNNAYDLEA